MITEKQEVIEKIQNYFTSTENVDKYVCPFGGGNLDWIHSQAERIKLDLLKLFNKLDNKSDVYEKKMVRKQSRRIESEKCKVNKRLRLHIPHNKK